ncbi:serine palmitoyltransferase 2 [Piptocephalis cylindrospora]|uniref:serine C-palmitoyltransferase n=1 Tax=Piptocephalis cylindrospora TaxID=1907219 RepID=A0A4P9Y1K2_9FUNG|nr:serine palmitoyltransferase 2 [Piptocephalis cylindrospora]|eukprot:RKP12667.1 serine palmitoyltransferase 2 [Piptocephalis cylindrospora]
MEPPTPTPDVSVGSGINDVGGFPLLHRRASVPSPLPSITESKFPYPVNSNPEKYQETPKELEEIPLFTYLTTYLSYGILLLIGKVLDKVGSMVNPKKYAFLLEQDGLAPVVDPIESMYTRRMYYRIRDCFSRPVTGVPGRSIAVMNRTTTDYNKTFQYNGKATTVLNLSSYNYLGFAQAKGSCADAVEDRVSKIGNAFSSPRMDGGTSALHREVEVCTAGFVGTEDAMVVSMGYATNSTTLPALVGKGCLLISDSLNHASLVAGARLSGASIRVFKHNDIGHLESILRRSISQGQPKTGRAWKKVLVVVEGLYSMEGDFCDLPRIVDLKDKYKFYLYLDEAHSVGAMGPSGRGMCDYFGIPPSKIDILMGTFTKSFGAAGGYIAGSRALIQHLRIHSHSSIYAEPVSIPVLQQSLTSLRTIAGLEGGNEGKERLDRLAENTQYFRKRLTDLGFILYGQKDSPIIPLLLFQYGKLASFSRECLALGIAVVVVSYPATPIITARARFCVSASHTREDLDKALDIISEAGDRQRLKLMSS